MPNPRQPIPPEPHQESVWDYPRPPRVEPSTNRIRIYYNGELIVDSSNTHRVLETSHPPVYYIPLQDIKAGILQPTRHRTFCEYKGAAHYYTLTVGEKSLPNGAWYYPDPTAGYESIANHVAFYPGKMDECYVNEERVQAQAGDFYGGWITSDIVGPFKGAPGTLGW
jgi:uncharacterized protein (DUF427 family)